MLEFAIDAGAKDCVSKEKVHEIISQKEDFYKVKNKFEKKINDFIYSGIEWRPNNSISLNNDQNEKVLNVLEALDDDDDVQNTFINCKIEIN